MDEQKRVGLELALENRLSDDLRQLTVRPYADYKRAAFQRGDARSSGARPFFSFVGIGTTVAIALLLAIGAASALLNLRSSNPASSPTATPAVSTSWRDQLIADVRTLQPQLAFVPLIPSFMPVDQPARVGTRTECVATTPCLDYSFPGVMKVLQGPAGCCLDSARPNAVRDIEIRPGVNAQFIPNQAQFGGPILWWVERTARGDVYVALSSPVYGREELIRVARSMVALSPP
jgi:hypothetical protein